MNQAPQVVMATIFRNDRGALVVEVGDMVLGERPHLAEAVHCLCEHAIAYQQALVVTITSGSGKQYMSIDKTGQVSPAAAPAPRTARQTFAPRDLSTSRYDEDASHQWVQKFILDPNQSAPQQAEPEKKRRRGLFRRG